MSAKGVQEVPPDTWLEGFTDVTSRVRRPSSPRASSSRRPIGVLAVAALATSILAAVGVVLYVAAPAPSLPGGEVPTLPTHHETDIGRGGQFTAVTGGKIMLNDGCVYLEIPTRRWLVVWPTGTRLDRSRDPAVILDRNDARIVAIGDVFSMQGASYDPSSLGEIASLLDNEIPAPCVGHEFLLADPNVTALRPGPATWRIDPAREPDATSATINVLMTELACSSGLSPAGRILPPDVQYRPDAIVITMSVLDIGGRCQGIPEHPFVVTLAEPIGERILIDGSDQTVRWRPE